MTIAIEPVPVEELDIFNVRVSGVVTHFHEMGASNLDPTLGDKPRMLHDGREYMTSYAFKRRVMDSAAHRAHVELLCREGVSRSNELVRTMPEPLRKKYGKDLENGKKVELSEDEKEAFIAHRLSFFDYRMCAPTTPMDRYFKNVKKVDAAMGIFQAGWSVTRDIVEIVGGKISTIGVTGREDEGKGGTFGNAYRSLLAIYQTQFCLVGGSRARANRVTNEDIEKLYEGLKYFLEDTRRAADVSSGVFNVVLFERPLNAGGQDHNFWDRVTIEATTETPRSHRDFEVKVDRKGLEDTVNVRVLVP